MLEFDTKEGVTEDVKGQKILKPLNYNFSSMYYLPNSLVSIIGTN